MWKRHLSTGAYIVVLCLMIGCSDAKAQTFGLGIDPYQFYTIVELSRLQRPQIITARVTVNGPVGVTANWSVSTRTVSGGNWLSVSPSRGTNNGSITVTIDTSSWVVGTYEGFVEVSAPGSINVASLHIRERIVRAEIRTMWLSGPNGSIDATSGGIPPAHWAIDTNGFPFTATVETRSGANWVQTRVEGIHLYITFGAPRTDVVRIRLDCAEAWNSPMYIEYSVVVREPLPPIVLTPSTLSFRVRQGGTVGAQAIRLSAGPGASGPHFSWTAAATTASGGEWLTINPDRGEVRFNPEIYVSVNPGGLPVGRYSGSITVSSTSGFSPGGAAIELIVEPAAELRLEPSSLVFQSVAGVDPSQQAVAVSATTPAGIGWRATASTSSGGNWLSVTPTSGATPAKPVVAVNTTGMQPGSYRGSVSFSTTEPDIAPRSLDVNLTIAAASTISLRPSELRFVTAAAMNPPSSTFQIANSGQGTLGWIASVETSSGGNWLSVSPTTGTAPSTVTAQVQSASSPRGVHSGRIRIAALPSANARNSPQFVDVLLAVGVPAIGDGGVVNGATFGRSAGLAAGSVVSLFGTQLSAGTESSASVPLPLTLAGTQVLVNSRAAPLYFVSPNQINFQMPSEAIGTTVIQVVSTGLAGLTATLRVDPEAPGIFTADSSGSGQALVLNQDSTLNTTNNPAAAGSVIQIFCTGLGATVPAFQTGHPGATQPPFNQTVVTPTVFIGGVASEVLFSGLAPGYVGLYQLNARIPPGLSGPSITLHIRAGTSSSNLVTVAIR